MLAGTGVLHSEFNAADVATHFFQIWILPRTDNLEPSYEQRPLSGMATINNETLLTSPDGRDNSLSIHQDVFLYKINPGQSPTRVRLDRYSCQFIQVTEGMCSVDGQSL